MRQVLELLRQDETFSDLCRAVEVKGGIRANLFGLEESQAAYWFVAMAEQVHKPLVLVVPDELRARQMVEDLRAFVPEDEQVELFFARDLHLNHIETASHELEERCLASLQAFLSGRCRYLILSAKALLTKLRPAKRELEAGVELRLGDVIRLAELEERLLSYGYVRVQKVEQVGEFARRGDVLDFAPLQAPEGHAYRLSFFDDDLDEMKCFRLDDQRSVETLERVELRPVRLITGMDFEATVLAERVEAALQTALVGLRKQAFDPGKLEKLRQRIQQDLAQIELGHLFPNLDCYLPFVFEEAESVLDYAARLGALVVVEEAAQVRVRLDAAQADFAQRFSTALEKGQVLPFSYDGYWSVQEVFLKLDQQRSLMSYARLNASGNGFPKAKQGHVHWRGAERFHGNDEALSAYVRMHAAAGERVFAFVGSPERADLLEQRRLEEAWPLTVLRSSLKRGFEAKSASLIVLGEEDLFGSTRQRRPRKKDKNSLRLNFFSELKVGDKVVHENHGIGVYEGIQNTKDAAGQRRDYLKIRYASGDGLYLPMDQLAQIQKYVGTDADEVKLSRLGGGEWQRQKERARSSIKQLVTDLIKLYSERAQIKGHAFQAETPWDRQFADAFPYEETEDQLRCIREIHSDMESEKVMDRLLCGDVGFGKTEVAFRAIFKCVQDGFQAALLAPTTVLAQQHYENFLRRVDGFPVRVGLLSRFAPLAERKKVLRQLEAGLIDVVIGTHRLLSKDVKFSKLGLLVVDEEQRFGVDHKELLKTQVPTVDVLSLSATPIPRTLHMSMSGIRDISVLEEAPEERRPVETMVSEYDPLLIQEAILREVARGGQVFYLHNDTHSIDRKAEELRQQLPGLRVLVAHGKLTERQLEEVIKQFLEGEADVLVCTTIIESGIDMPRVNTIIVEKADRLGLAQLYQIRGRVGRSERQAYAYITYEADKVLTEVASKRLLAIKSFTELGAGFVIALRDLELRGAGNLLGAEQHGQLNAIGYDLYTRMLSEEIGQAKEAVDQGLSYEEAAGKAAYHSETSFEIPLDAYIPASYISEDGERMELYRRISRINGAALYQDVLDELLDRYGEPCWEVMTLMDVAYLRHLAGQLGIARITQHKESLVFYFDSGVKLDMEKLSCLMSLAKYEGQLLFNAGLKPFIVYRGVGTDVKRYPEKLRKLWLAYERKWAQLEAEKREKTCS